MNEWHSFTLMQIARDVSEIKAQMSEVTTWLQRGALLVFLWGAGMLTNANPEKAGELIAALIKSLK